MNGKQEANSILIDRIKNLIDEIYIINELFVAYESLYNKRAHDLDVINWTPGLYQLTLYAFINQFVVMLSRMYDRNRDANSLYKLFAYIDSNMNNFGNSMQEIKKAVSEAKCILDEMENLADKLKKLRDVCLAHNDLEFIRSDAWTKYSPTVGEYRSLVTNAHEVICLLGNLMKIPTPMLGLGVKKEIDYLATILKKRI